eukprot:1104046-Pelagomonas_calceolata.AAC.2
MCLLPNHSDLKANLEAQSQHFRHADTNLANAMTSAWFMVFKQCCTTWGCRAKQMLELSAQVTEKKKAYSQNG